MVGVLNFTERCSLAHMARLRGSRTDHQLILYEKSVLPIVSSASRRPNGMKREIRKEGKLFSLEQTVFGHYEVTSIVTAN